MEREREKSHTLNIEKKRQHEGFTNSKRKSETAEIFKKSVGTTDRYCINAVDKMQSCYQT